MKLSFILLVTQLTFMGVLLASDGKGQNISKIQVSLPRETISLREALKEIEKQSDLKLIYGQEIDKYSAIRINTPEKTISVQYALEVLLKNTNLKYSLIGSHVVIETKPVPPKPGKISGKIVDDKGESLPSANIRIIELNKNIQSSVDGTYQLGVPPGTYTLEITFISYQTKRITSIVVAEGKLTLLDIAMQPANKALNEVVITSSYKKASVEGLYARQKNAAGITDGISAEQIGRTPDKNIGETLKRISGLSSLDNKYVVVRGLSERYNQAMMNGQMMPSTELNRKNFSFDLIPSNLVDNVIVTKTLTPDQSAEFGGGLVQVNTKEIPQENSFSITIGSSVNDLTTGKLFRSPEISGSQYLAGIPDGRKLLGSADWKSRADIFSSGKFTDADEPVLKDLYSFPNNWAIHNYTPLPSLNGQVSIARVIPLEGDKKLGIIASASYHNTWQTQEIRMSRDGYNSPVVSGPVDEQVTFKGNRYGFTTNLGGIAGIGYSDPRNKVSLQSIYLKTSDQQFVFGTGYHDIALQSAGYYDLFAVTNLWQSQLKSEHAIGNNGIKANFALSYTRLDRQKPDNHQANLTYLDDGQDTPLNPDQDFSVTQATSGGISRGALRSWSRALENNLGWNADITVPYRFSLGGMQVSNTLKTGYAGWRKDRLFWVLNTGSTGSLNGGISKPLSELFEPAEGAAIYGSKFGDDFHKKPSLHAAYVMSDNKLGDKLRLVWGVRAEYYNLNNVNSLLDNFVATQRSFNNDLTDYSDLFNREPDWNFFPSANLTYSLTSKMNLRLAYSKSIIRPDLRETSYFHEYDFELGGMYQSESPIISTKIQHFDFRYEWYPSAGELVSFSLFYKKLLYPMEVFADENRIFTLRNDKDAVNKGIEVELRKSFAFTGVPVLKNITVYGNMTRLFAKVRRMTVDYRSTDESNPSKLFVHENVLDWENRPQAGASNYTYNAGINYDQGAFSASVSYNYITNRFYRVSNFTPASLYEQPMRPLDAQLAYQFLKKKATIKFNLSNLLASKYLIYINRYDDGREVPADGRQPSTKELLYDKGKDLLDYEAGQGRTYSLGFSYNF